MPGEEKIRNAAGRVLGSVPSFWHLDQIAERLDRLKPLSEQNVMKLDPALKMPPSAYLSWLLREKGWAYIVHNASVLSEATITAFEQQYNDMAESAQLLAKLDKSNFVAESSITPIQDLLQKSVLSISTLYRYIAAQEYSMEYLLTDELILKAIKELGSNPYLFFAYGEDAQELMPVLWEDL